MPANTTPVFSTPAVAVASNAAETTFGGTVLTATGDYSGVSANHVRVMKAGENGAGVRGLIFHALGTNVATVARIYRVKAATGVDGSNITAASNELIGQITLPAVTGTNVASTSSPIWTPSNGVMPLPPGYEIWVGVATTIASGWKVSPATSAWQY